MMKSNLPSLPVVNLIDVNDNIPTCSSNPYFVSVPESSHAGDVVTSLVCRDADNDPAYLNNALLFSIGNMGYINIINPFIN